MKRHIKSLFFCLIIGITAILPAACSSGGATQGGGLVVSGLTTSIGQLSSAVPTTQTYSYRVTIENKSDITIYLQSIEPVVSKNVESKVLVDNLVKNVGRNIAGGGNIEVTSNFPFDATGMSKDDINKMEPFIIGFKVMSEETLPVPGQK